MCSAKDFPNGTVAGPSISITTECFRALLRTDDFERRMRAPQWTREQEDLALTHFVAIISSALQAPVGFASLRRRYPSTEVEDPTRQVGGQRRADFICIRDATMAISRPSREEIALVL